ncbi:MAG: hypothetical protein JRD89_17570, partial [Deltaproteobacteria bacterium]|nr:hypothetical protein [Deltaproteobacteria bacterium]
MTIKATREGYIFEISRDPDKKGGFAEGTRFSAYQAQAMLVNGSFTEGTRVIIWVKEKHINKKPGPYYVYSCAGYGQHLLAGRSEFQKLGREILSKDGWLVFFTGGTRKNAPQGMKGFPDIVAFGKNRVAIIEVKFGQDKL